MKQLKQSDIKVIREQWHEEQDNICPILKQTVDLSDVCLDHQHKLKSEDPDETGKGLCRGVIHFQANAWEGKVLSSFKRVGLDKMINIVDALRNLADYLEHNKIHEGEHYIHPSEAPKKPTLTKRCHNKLVKAVNGKQKVPPYIDKKGNLTKPLERLFEKYNIEIEYKKS
jgi:hypothetical protein